MKHFLWLVFFIVLCGCSSEEYTIYVSPYGRDVNPGTYENPIATMDKAREIIRNMPDRNVNVRVIFRGGEYVMEDKVVFSCDDSAPDGYTYSYEAYPGETPVFTPAVRLKGWKKTKQYPVSVDEDILDKIWEVEIPGNYPEPYVLFYENGIIQRSRKGGFLIKPIKPLDLSKHKNNPSANEYNAARSMNVYFDKDRSLLKEFYFQDEKGILKDWTKDDNIEVAFAPVPWNLNILPLEKVDFKKGKVYTTIEANAPAGAKLSHTMPWVENTLEYITPGTFVYRDKKIYYCKKEDETLDLISAPLMTEMVLLSGDIDYYGEDVPVKNLSFKGLTFCNGNRHTWDANHKGWGIQHDWDKFDTPNAMFRMRGAENCMIESCRFTNSACSAIRLDLYCKHNVLKNNLIDYVGHMGILLCGYGPGIKDVNKCNVISNNIIHHVGQVITHGAAIFMWQSGENIVSNNLIHHVPRKGIGVCGVRMPILIKDWCDFDEASKTIRWNEIDSINFNRYKNGKMTLGEYWKLCLPYLHARNNIIENNEIHHALERLADGAVVNVSGAGVGNIVRSNYIHHILSHASGAIRTDDWQCNTLFEKNIVYNSNIPGAVHKGFNDIVNNYFIDCSTKSYIRFASYPDEEPGYGSKVQKNIFYETAKKTKFYGKNYLASKGIAFPENCKTDYNLFYSEADSASAVKHMYYYRNLGIENHSIIANPAFLSTEDCNSFVMSENSPAFTLGIEPIDMGMIGLRTEIYPSNLFVLGEVNTDRGDSTDVRIGKVSDSYEFW